MSLFLFYVMMFGVPAGIILLSIYLAMKTKFK